MELRLYDTWTRSLRAFEPLHPGRASLYCCGPTVYDHAHIGNLRTYLFEDVLKRVLQWNGLAVRHVVNITDVGHLTDDADAGEDKMEKGSRRAGRSARELADFYTAAFRQDLARLSIIEPDTWCRATDYIGEQIAFIEKLEEKGFTYRTPDGLYFDTSRQPDYGHLARLDRKGLRDGARVDTGDKRQGSDFALWKLSPPDSRRQMEWDSPWGCGFPGWHIECSAMSAHAFGGEFDIHCGGEDHIPVHHSNEIAQNEACHGSRLANFWMHGYFLKTGEDAKMSKSTGDFLTLDRLLEEGHEPAAYRYLCLSAHYRHQMVFSWQALGAAGTALGRLRTLALEGGEGGEADAGLLARFTTHVNDDLDMPGALALAWEVARDAALTPDVRRATLAAFDRVLGLGLGQVAATAARIEDPALLALAARRWQARLDKNWAEADRLRAELAAAGVEMQDGKTGWTLHKARS